jgi:mannose-6-phosphate isomerase-like protein (cupin superfamily)
MEALTLPGGFEVELHLDGTATGGALCLLVDHPPPGWSLPPHRHRDEAETIHVIAGTFDLTVEGERRILRPGETAHVPRGALHGGGNVGSTPGRRLVIFSPAGMEEFFREAAGADQDAALAAALRHGWQFGA